MFKIAKAPVDDAGGAAGGAGGKVGAFEQQDALAMLGAFAGDRHPVDASAYDGYIEASRCYRCSSWNSAAHRFLDALPTSRAGHNRPNRGESTRLRWCLLPHGGPCKSQTFRFW